MKLGSITNTGHAGQIEAGTQCFLLHQFGKLSQGRHDVMIMTRSQDMRTYWVFLELAGYGEQLKANG